MLQSIINNDRNDTISKLFDLAQVSKIILEKHVVIYCVYTYYTEKIHKFYYLIFLYLYRLRIQAKQSIFIL